MGKTDLKNEGQGQGGEKLDLRHSTSNFRFNIGEFLSEL